MDADATCDLRHVAHHGAHGDIRHITQPWHMTIILQSAVCSCMHTAFCMRIASNLQLQPSVICYITCRFLSFPIPHSTQWIPEWLLNAK